MPLSKSSNGRESRAGIGREIGSADRGPGDDSEPAWRRRRNLPGSLSGNRLDGRNRPLGLGRDSLFGILVLAAVLPFLVRIASNIAVHLRFEDSLIVLRYARNLVEGAGFVFNPGERVLGVTTPGQTFLAAGLLRVAGDAAVSWLNVAGVVVLGLEVLVVALLARRHGGWAAGALAGALALGNYNSSYLYLGMEVHLFAFLALLACSWFLLDRQLAAGWVLGIAFLVRPDAAILAGVIGLGFLVKERKWPGKLTAAFTACALPWLVFAQSYFGSMAPQTLRAKQGFLDTGTYLYRVAVYYKRTLEAVLARFTDSPVGQDVLAWWLGLVALAGVVLLLRKDRRFVVVLAYPLVHLLAYAWIGADSAFTWHYYILNPFLWLVLAAGVHGVVTVSSRLAARTGSWGALRGPVQRATASVLLSLITIPLLVGVHRSSGHRYRLDPATQDFFRIADWLDARYGPETSLLHPSIGVLGYETSLRIVDRAGLITPGLRYLDGVRFTPLGEVLERYRPDLVLTLAGHDPEVRTYGYRVLREFPGHRRYLLFKRSEAGESPSDLIEAGVDGGKLVRP